MIEAIITDIEGTTSSISFVHEVLFPYAAEHLPAYLREHRSDEAVRLVLADTAALAALPEDDTEALIAQLLSWIAEDRKVTPLKTLQGLIWEQGYRRGDYRAHVYADAADYIKRWHDAGLPLYVYSSGSVYAQKLFFAHSEAGDLLNLFSGHFDTTTGAKQDSESYRRIAAAIGRPAEKLLFLSDIEAELDAARAAGMQTCWLLRDGSPEGISAANAPHPIAHTFADIRL